MFQICGLKSCRRTSKFQVRQYQPFLVAETPLDNIHSSSSSSSEPSQNGTQPSSNSSSSSDSKNNINPASAGMKAFNALAGYIFGGNAEGRKMAMTMPVYTDTAGTMQFVVATEQQQVSFEGLGVVGLWGLMPLAYTWCVNVGH